MVTTAIAKNLLKKFQEMQFLEIAKDKKSGKERYSVSDGKMRA